MVGMFSRMAAISMPGVILSQFDMQTIASTLCALHMVLDAVGDQVARRQRVEHAVVTHGDAVVDGDRVEFGGEAAFAFDPLLDLLPDLVKVHMPGHELRKRVDDGNHPAGLSARLSFRSLAIGFLPRPFCAPAS